ncbi:MAG: hypothetical protein R2847_11345 [Bacteroidia bacterium]
MGTNTFALGQLWMAGSEPDWKNFYALEKRKKLRFPAILSKKKSYWLEPLTPKNNLTTTTTTIINNEVMQQPLFPMMAEQTPTVQTSVTTKTA